MRRRAALATLEAVQRARASMLGHRLALCATLSAGVAPHVAHAQQQPPDLTLTREDTLRSNANSTDIRALARQVADDYARRARDAERTGRVHSAQALFARAVESDPSYLPGYLGAARVLEARAMHTEARATLASVPLRAIERDDDAVELARARALLGDVDEALALLDGRLPTVAVLRAQVELASLYQRFPTALAAARRLYDTAREADAQTRVQADALSRALAQLVGESDAVRYPPRGSPPLREALASYGAPR